MPNPPDSIVVFPQERIEEEYELCEVNDELQIRRKPVTTNTYKYRSLVTLTKDSAEMTIPSGP